MPCTSLGSGPTPSCIRRGPWLMQTNTWRVPTLPQRTAHRLWFSHADEHLRLAGVQLPFLFSFALLLACYRGFRLRCQGRAGHKKKTTHTSSRVVSSWYWPASSLWSMQVPAGFLGKLWSFVSFVPFFILLLLLGSIKGNSSSTDWTRLLFMNCLCVDDLIFWFVVLCSVLTIVYVMCGSGRCKWFTLLFCSCPSRSGYGFHRILWELCGYYWPLACAFHLDILLCS